MSQRVAIVTGANVGIGRETARGLAEAGFTVVLAVRDVVKGEEARHDIVRSGYGGEAPIGTTKNDRVTVLPLDLGSRASITAFVSAFKEAHPRLDVLVNNAGIWPRSKTTTVDGFETTFGVNHLGTFLLTRELLPVLEASAPSRIVVLSSGIHYRGRMEWDDLQFETRRYAGTAAYAQSKLANVLFTKALARRLEGTGVAVNAVHPGVVATELLRDIPRFARTVIKPFLLTPKDGAATSLHVALSEEGARVSGAYFEKSAQRVASRAARDEDAQERLWTLSEKLLGLPLSPIPASRSSSPSPAASKRAPAPGWPASDLTTSG